MYTKSKVVFITSVAALASLAIQLTIQQQGVAAFNDNNNEGVTNTHDHITSGSGSSFPSNSGTVINGPNLHSNENCNSHSQDDSRSGSGGCKTNSNVKP